MTALLIRSKFTELAANHDKRYINRNISGALSFAILNSRLLHCNSGWAEDTLLVTIANAEAGGLSDLPKFATNCIYTCFDTNKW